MPEGPEVRTIATQLYHEVKGRYLLGIQYDQRSRYNKDGLKNQKAARGEIIDVTCYGKKIIFRLAPSKQPQIDRDGSPITLGTQVSHHQLSNEYIYIISSLGLEGRWCRSKEGMNHANLWMNFGHTRPWCPVFNPSTENVTGFGTGVFRDAEVRSPGVPACGAKVGASGCLSIIEKQLWFDDSRHFGTVEILYPEDFQQRINTIGVCLLSYPEQVTPQAWLSRSRSPRLQKKQICDYLMNQSYWAGVGNYLKAEILYHARIRPDRTLGQLTDLELERLRQITLSIIHESFRLGGHTSRTYRGLDPQATGQYQVVVYGKKYDPLGNPIVTDTFGDKRTTHWVPNVQF